MIAGIGLILACQLAGEGIARAFALPIPAPVIGLMLLVALLVTRDRMSLVAHGPLAEGRVEHTARALLAHLSLLFVPAGVGVVQKLDLIATHGLAIATVLICSVVLTMLVTVAAFRLSARLLGRLRSDS